MLARVWRSQRNFASVGDKKVSGWVGAASTGLACSKEGHHQGLRPSLLHLRNEEMLGQRLAASAAVVLFVDLLVLLT